MNNVFSAPPAKRSAKAVGLERWALHYSWAQCAGCGLMLPKDLTQKALLRDRPATALPSECFRCRGARDLPAPKPEDVPAPLKGLTEEAAQALSPLEIDVGVEQRGPLVLLVAPLLAPCALPHRRPRQIPGPRCPVACRRSSP